MQAALTCTEQGHSVTLFEKCNELGGSIRCERNVPFKKKLDMYIETQKRRIERAGIEVRLSTALTPAIAGNLNPDVIIAATGARPIKPKILGVEGNNVIEAKDAYLYPDKAGKNIVIIGAGLVGLELAIYLSMLGRKVSIVEMADKANDGGNFLHMQGINVELKHRGIEVFLNTYAKEIKPDGLICQTEKDEIFFAAETIIYAVGQEPCREEALSLNNCAPEFYMLGDCVMPSNITTATGTAYDIARNIGRI
jgi:NADPH-dependent 2,4-dienoyl-CoA reductase/sulfur reductase-like enzyme